MPPRSRHYAHAHVYVVIYIAMLLKLVVRRGSCLDARTLRMRTALVAGGHHGAWALPRALRDHEDSPPLAGEEPLAEGAISPLRLHRRVHREANGRLGGVGTLGQPIACQRGWVGSERGFCRFSNNDSNDDSINCNDGRNRQRQHHRKQ